jgi:hypothetical protein
VKHRLGCWTIMALSSSLSSLSRPSSHSPVGLSSSPFLLSASALLRVCAYTSVERMRKNAASAHGRLSAGNQRLKKEGERERDSEKEEPRCKVQRKRCLSSLRMPRLSACRLVRFFIQSFSLHFSFPFWIDAMSVDILDSAGARNNDAKSRHILWLRVVA